MVSSIDGSPTVTGWKRRSSAGSFSMYFRYSLRVVAPIARSSPRASAGFSMFEASIDPSAAPAPTSVCSSSMKRMIWPSDSVTSFSTALRRSSNSPRYLAPATRAARSRATMRFGFRTSGTSPAIILCARPSTIAVLPTPGSPISTGLFFVRRAANFLVAADDRVELAAARSFGEVARVLLDGAIRRFGILGRDAMTAADGGHGLQDGVMAGAVARQNLPRRISIHAGNSQQDMLG